MPAVPVERSALDHHRSKMLKSVHPVLLCPWTWAQSVSSSGKRCQIRPMATRVTTGKAQGCHAPE